MSSVNFTAIIVIAFVIVNSFHVNCQRHPRRTLKCTAAELQKCTHFLESLSDSNDFALPSNREELHHLCDNSREGVRCLDEHIKWCFTPEQTLVFKELINPARYFISQLCDTAAIQREFLKHAPCFKNVSVDAGKCAEKYRQAIQVTSQAYASPLSETDHTMRRSCCVLGEFLDCKYHHVARDCGRSAESFMRNHMEPIINPINRHCSAYTYGTEACALLPVQVSTSLPMAAVSINNNILANSSQQIQVTLISLFLSSLLSLSLPQ